METFITFEDVQTRIQNHPDFSLDHKKKLTNRVSISDFNNVAKQPIQILHNTRQSNNGKKCLQPRSSN